MRRATRRPPAPLIVLVALALPCAGMLTSALAIGAPAPAQQQVAVVAGERTGANGETGIDLTEISPLPDVTAEAFLVQDAAADEPLAAKDSATSRPIASLTKLMTALLVTERTQPDDLVTVPSEAAALGAEAASMGLHTGERWRAEDLLQAMLTYSANDAAVALAVHVGKGSEEDFIGLMNERAAELDLTGTNYTSVTGLDEPGKLTTSTPLDLVSLATVAFEEPRIRAAVRREELTLTRPGSQPGDADATIKLANRNPLLGRYAGVDGIKTGFTDAAGYMLLLHYADRVGNDLFVAVADSSSEATRAADGRALLDWAAPLRQRLRMVEGGTPLGTLPVTRSGRTVDVFACDDAFATVRVGQELEQRVSVPRAIVPPVHEGDEVGELSVLVGGTEVERVPICSADTILAEGWRGEAKLYLSEYRTAWFEGVDYVRGQARKATAA